MSEEIRGHILSVVLAAIGAAIPVAAGVLHLKDWLVNHPDVAEVVKSACGALLNGNGS